MILAARGNQETFEMYLSSWFWKITLKISFSVENCKVQKSTKNINHL